MTIEQVIAKLETETGCHVDKDTQLKDIIVDSLEFLDLMVSFNIPDECVPDVNMVSDLQRFAA